MKPSFCLIALVAALLVVAPASAQSEFKARYGQLHQIEVLEGQVTVDVLWGAGIGVALDLAPADGTVDRLYVLQKAAHAPEELPLVFASARVLVDRELVVVTGAPHEQGVALMLAGAEHLPEQMETLNGELAGVTGKRGPALAAPYVYTGFGLAERWGSWEAPFHELAYESQVLGKSGCDAGGVGSTSCSVGCNGGCSTSCSSGYYACCDCIAATNSCTCVADGGGSLGGGGGFGGGGGGGSGECTTNGYCPAACMSCSPYYAGEEETPETAGS
jgi:hypothetical protein